VWIPLRRAALIASLMSACSAPPPPLPIPAEPAAQPAPREPTPVPEPPPEPAQPALPPFCAEVDIGLDLRALPTHAGPDGVDMFVRGEAQDLRDVTAEDPPRIFTTRGVGTMRARFDATSASAAQSRCERAVAAYLKTAPRLPVLMTPAAHVTTSCRSCE
jgi:hypothetical protein